LIIIETSSSTYPYGMLATKTALGYESMEKLGIETALR
jgi:hypothetical protein